MAKEAAEGGSGIEVGIYGIATNIYGKVEMRPEMRRTSGIELQLRKPADAVRRATLGHD